jgi:hypothetical protein
MSWSRNFALGMTGYAVVSLFGRGFEGWDFALFVAAVAAILLVVSWVVVRPNLITPESRR